MKRLFLFVCCSLCLSCSNDIEIQEPESDVEILKRIIVLQDSMIEKAKSELESHLGDYAFCDGDEPILIDELKARLNCYNHSYYK